MLNLNFQNGTTPALNARNMNAIVESINTLGYAVGGPNVASTVSEMTDTEKVYVYTGSETGYTAGNWYYYNGSAWVSGGVYQAAAVETDTTLTMPGEPADAKATGDAVVDLKNDLNGLESATLTDRLPFTLTMGSGVDPSTGMNYSGQRYARTSIVLIPYDRMLVIRLDDSDYEFVAWTYLSNNTGSAVISPTNNTYMSGVCYVPFSSAYTGVRIGIQRKDHANMTSGTEDQTTDEYRLLKAISYKYLSNDDASIIQYTKRIEIALKGGVFEPCLKQGGLAFNSSTGLLTDSQTLKKCSIYANAPLLLKKGDIVSVGTFTALMSSLNSETDGFTRGTFNVSQSGDIVIPETGYYSLSVGNSDDSDIVLDDALGKIKCVCGGLLNGIELAKEELPKNPYKHIAKDKIANDDYVWSSLVKDIKSTCHLHTLRALYFTRAVNAGYEHIAISNYHASKPTVPIAEILPTLNDYDASRDVVPSEWLESPNAEHVYFTDADEYVGASARTHLHMCSVGSYATSGTDNTSAGEGGFEGTVEDFSKAFEEMRQYPNGGGITINHPIWSGIDADGMLNLMKIPHVFAMEIYNANAQHVNGKGYALDLWNEILSTGNQIFGTAVPDHETEGSFWFDHLPLGFVHLLCVTKTEKEIMLAYRNGRFYTTIGNDTLLLKYFGIDDNGLVTFKTTDIGTIKFVTSTRNVIVENNNVATFQTNNTDVFVRAEIETASNRLFTNAIIL